MKFMSDYSHLGLCIYCVCLSYMKVIYDDSATSFYIILHHYINNMAAHINELDTKEEY